jgi:hypothetical protein
VLGMRLCRRGERGDAEEGWVCNGFGDDEEGMQVPGGGWTIPTRKGFPWRLGVADGAGSDDLTSINARSLHLSVLTLGLSALLVDW